MPTFQDENDPIVDSSGVILYDRFGFENIPQTTRFNRLGPDSYQLPDLIVGRAYTPREELTAPKFVLQGSMICLASEVTSNADPLRLGTDHLPWGPSTPRHSFYILLAGRGDGEHSAIHLLHSRSADCYVFSLNAARAAFMPVPRMIVCSKVQDLRTKVTVDSTVTRRVRSLQYRTGSLFNFQSLDNRVRNRITELFNDYLRRIDSPFVVPEERPARDMPVSPPERTEVPPPEPEVAEPAPTPEPERLPVEFAVPPPPNSPPGFINHDEVPRSSDGMSENAWRQYASAYAFAGFNQSSPVQGGVAPSPLTPQQQQHNIFAQAAAADEQRRRRYWDTESGEVSFN